MPDFFLATLTQMPLLRALCSASQFSNAAGSVNAMTPTPSISSIRLRLSAAAQYGGGRRPLSPGVERPARRQDMPGRPSTR